MHASFSLPYFDRPAPVRFSIKSLIIGRTVPSINGFIVLPYIVSSNLRSREREGVMGVFTIEGLGNEVILIVGGTRYLNSSLSFYLGIGIIGRVLFSPGRSSSSSLSSSLLLLLFTFFLIAIVIFSLYIFLIKVLSISSLNYIYIIGSLITYKKVSRIGWGS